MSQSRHYLQKLQAIPFVFTNELSLFPAFLFAQISVHYPNKVQFILPFILFYSFKTTILFLFRKKPMNCQKLLMISMYLGVFGCIIGAFFTNSAIGLAISSMFLGATSGTAFPSFRTLFFHWQEQKGLKRTKKDSYIEMIFSAIFFFTLFTLLQKNLSVAFIWTGLAFLLTLSILPTYPPYTPDNHVPVPDYTHKESIFLFLTVFFSMFLIKQSTTLGYTDYLYLFFIFLTTILVVYGVLTWQHKLTQPFPPHFLILCIYKGLLLNFLFIFCSAYLVFLNSPKALYTVYTIYLIGLLSGPIVRKQIQKLLPNTPIFHLFFTGIMLSLALLTNKWTFLVGIYFLSVFITQLNRQLNTESYHDIYLPEDIRLVSKYRLTNLGSVLNQALILAIFAIFTKKNQHISIQSLYDHTAPLMHSRQIFIKTKFILLIFFAVFTFIFLLLPEHMFLADYFKTHKEMKKQSK